LRHGPVEERVLEVEVAIRGTDCVAVFLCYLLGRLPRLTPTPDVAKRRLVRLKQVSYLFDAVVLGLTHCRDFARGQHRIVGPKGGGPRSASVLSWLRTPLRPRSKARSHSSRACRGGRLALRGRSDHHVPRAGPSPSARRDWDRELRHVDSHEALVHTGKPWARRRSLCLDRPAPNRPRVSLIERQRDQCESEAVTDARTDRRPGSSPRHRPPFRRCPPTRVTGITSGSRGCAYASLRY
jgi:hypothetical protein